MITRLRRWLLLAVGSLALLIMVGAPATALPPGGASPNTPGTSASLSPTSLEAGDKISFKLQGFPAGETVNVKIDDGEECGEAAVHGACVVYKQRISAGSTIGSFKVPKDLKKGSHTLRFLATENVKKDGKVVGTLGYTLRSPAFTIVAAEKSSTTKSSNGSTKSSTSNGRTSGSTTDEDDTESTTTSSASPSATPTATASSSSTPKPSPSASKKKSKKKASSTKTEASAAPSTRAGDGDAVPITPEPVSAVVTGAGLSVAQAIGVGGGAVGLAAVVGGLTAWWRRGGQ